MRHPFLYRGVHYGLAGPLARPGRAAGRVLSLTVRVSRTRSVRCSKSNGTGPRPQDPSPSIGPRTEHEQTSPSAVRDADCDHDITILSVLSPRVLDLPATTAGYHASPWSNHGRVESHPTPSSSTGTVLTIRMPPRPGRGPLSDEAPTSSPVFIAALAAEGPGAAATPVGPAATHPPGPIPDTGGPATPTSIVAAARPSRTSAACTARAPRPAVAESSLPGRVPRGSSSAPSDEDGENLTVVEAMRPAVGPEPTTGDNGEKNRRDDLGSTPPVASGTTGDVVTEKTSASTSAPGSQDERRARRQDGRSSTTTSTRTKALGFVLAGVGHTHSRRPYPPRVASSARPPVRRDLDETGPGWNNPFVDARLVPTLERTGSGDWVGNGPRYRRHVGFQGLETGHVSSDLGLIAGDLGLDRGEGCRGIRSRGGRGRLGSDLASASTGSESKDETAQKHQRGKATGIDRAGGQPCSSRQLGHVGFSVFRTSSKGGASLMTSVRPAS